MASVLVTGGSGYLGQFLVSRLSERRKVGYTYNSHLAEALNVLDGVKAFKVDMATGEGLQECLSSFGDLACIVNCAAISKPGECEEDPERARSINIPTKLLDALLELRSATGQEPLLIHISTDQVYDGSKEWWREDDTCQPVNVYGKTKLEAESAVQARWPNHAILRSSIIYGPQPLVPVSRPLMLDFIVSSLRSGQETSFIEDEFRCPIFVDDIVAVVDELMAKGAAVSHRLFNMGGPQRMSRVDMAMEVANHLGTGTDTIVRVPSSSFKRNVRSPLDISMRVERLATELDIKLTPFAGALSKIFPQ
ncbi:unnamed protein product [Ostreobium quekettii]|uniref:RmlD-like substrate binding domain-containing protein n=1 Tax=Ostreobium quekettii TaxID=121088 RepID=A0A8S1IUT4_9CHLO|nr:unnamed protein product [Ostreobium quekettii]